MTSRVQDDYRTVNDSNQAALNALQASNEAFRSKQRLRLGVLGGMGPLATAVFYARLVDLAKLRAKCDQDHPDVLIWSDCSLPDRTTAIKTGDSAVLLAQCKRDFQLLEQAACDYICFPCNTLHYFMPELVKMSKLPLLNMVDLTLKQLRESKPACKTIQIFATDGTRDSRLYETYAAKYNFDVVANSDSLQAEIMQFIYELKNTGRTDFPLLSQRILQAHQKGVDAVILACTELSCMPLNAQASAYAVDAMDALILACLDLLLPASEN